MKRATHPGQTSPKNSLNPPPNRHSRAQPPSFPRRQQPTAHTPSQPPTPLSPAPTQPSFPRPPTVIPVQAGTHGPHSIPTHHPLNAAPTPTHRPSRAGGNPRPGRLVYCRQCDPLRIHPSQRHKRHPLHRRHLGPRPTCLATQECLRQRLRPPVRRRPLSVVRSAPIHRQRHLPRESPQEMAQSLENQANRRGQPILVRPLRKTRLTPPPNRHSRAPPPSFPRRREPTAHTPSQLTTTQAQRPPNPRHSRAGGNPRPRTPIQVESADRGLSSHGVDKDTCTNILKQVDLQERRCNCNTQSYTIST